MSGKAPPRFTADGTPIPARAPGPMGGTGQEFETLDQQRERMYEEREERYAAGDGDRHDDAIESIMGDVQAQRDYYYPQADGTTGQDVSGEEVEDFFDKSILGANYAAGQVVAANPGTETVPARNQRIYREALENAYNGEIPDPETDAARQARLVAEEIHFTTADRIAESVLTPDVSAQERQAMDDYLNEPDTDPEWFEDDE